MNFGMKHRLMSAIGDAGDGGGATPPADPGTGGGGAPPSNTVVPDWAKGVDPSLFDAPVMKNHKDIGSVIKSYVHAASLVGADKIVVPTKNSSPEEWRAYFQKAGLPESADKYELKVGEKSLFSGEKAKTIKELALANNILPSQMEKVLEFLDKDMNDMIEKDSKESRQEIETNLNGLKEKWGEEGYKKNVTLAAATAKHFGGDEFMNYLEESGLGDNSKLIEVFAQIGSKLKQEDTFKSDVTSRFGMTKTEAQAAINKLFSDEAYLNKSHASHNDKIQDMLKYQSILAEK